MLTARRLASAFLIVSGAGLTAGCATTEVAVQWSDPKFAGRSLRGEKVLVVCEAPDVAIRNNCQDDVAAQLRAAGAAPVIGSDPGFADGPSNEAKLAAARAAGAKAILGSTITRDVTVVGSGSSVGFGIGGFGSGGVSGRGGGVGIALPAGGGREASSYRASMVLTDVASAQVMWSGTITTQASENIDTQIHELARVGVEAAQKAGFF